MQPHRKQPALASAYFCSCSTMSRVNKLEYTVLILFFLYAALLLLNMKWVVEFSNESVNICKIFAWESTYSKDFWFTYCKILEVGPWSQNLFPQKQPACIILLSWTLIYSYYLKLLQLSVSFEGGFLKENTINLLFLELLRLTTTSGTRLKKQNLSCLMRKSD